MVAAGTRMGDHRFAEGIETRLYASCVSLVDCLAAPWPDRGRMEDNSAVGGGIAADDTGTMGVRCRNEIENAGTHSTGLDGARWEGDSNRDIETLEEGTRKHGTVRGIDHVHSSSLTSRDAEGEAAHNEAARRRGTQVTLIVREDAAAADESSLEGSASPSAH